MPRRAKSRGLPAALVVLLIGAFFLALGVTALQHLRARDLFRRYVLDPMPRSLADLRVDRPGAGCHVFRFALSETDFRSLLTSRPFREGVNFDCTDGTIGWDWKDPNGDANSPDAPFAVVGVYELARRPRWFDLSSWQDPETWAWIRRSDERLDEQVLIYNHALGQAYFITLHRERGRGL